MIKSGVGRPVLRGQTTRKGARLSRAAIEEWNSMIRSGVGRPVLRG